MPENLGSWQSIERQLPVVGSVLSILTEALKSLGVVLLGWVVTTKRARVWKQHLFENLGGLEHASCRLKLAIEHLRRNLVGNIVDGIESGVGPFGTGQGKGRGFVPHQSSKF